MTQRSVEAPWQMGEAPVRRGLLPGCMEHYGLWKKSFWGWYKTCGRMSRRGTKCRGKRKDQGGLRREKYERIEG